MTNPGEDTNPAIDEASSGIADIAELVRRFCIADSNVTVYGLAHPLATRSIEEAYGFLVHLRGGLKTPMVLSISEDKLLFEGFPVESRNARVARLTQRLFKLHVNTLRFLPGITLDEFTGFQELLAMKESDIEASGGVKKLLEMAGVTHIVISGAAYVLIDENDRVVDRHAVVAAPNAGDGDADAAVINYMLHEVVKESREKDWLLTRIKNDPHKMASLIADGIEKALAGGRGKVSDSDTIQSLIENIKHVGQSLMNQQDGEAAGEQTDIKDSVIELEKEIQMRARQLMTTEDSKRFVSEILSVVTTYSDQVKAQRISCEFLKGENNLKSTEKMLKNLAGKQETGEQLLLRLRNLMIKEGVKEKDLELLLQKVKKPARPRRKRRPADETLRDGIAQHVRGMGLDVSQNPHVIEQLTALFESRMANREQEFTRVSEKMGESLLRREQALDKIAGGVVIWDRDGNVDYVNEPAREFLRFGAGVALGPQVMAEIGKRSFPAPEIPPEEAEKNNWSVEVYRLLTSITVLVTDDSGAPVGAMIGLPAQRPTPPP